MRKLLITLAGAMLVSAAIVPHPQASGPSPVSFGKPK